MTAQDLMTRYRWEQMSNDRGRFVLAAGQGSIATDELLGPDADVRRLASVAGKDVIVLARFEEGGLISYERPDGSVVHTLNTERAFKLKVWEMGFDPATLTARDSLLR